MIWQKKAHFSTTQASTGFDPFPSLQAVEVRQFRRRRPWHGVSLLRPRSLSDLDAAPRARGDISTEIISAQKRGFIHNFSFIILDIDLKTKDPALVMVLILLYHLRHSPCITKRMKYSEPSERKFSNNRLILLRF